MKAANEETDRTKLERADEIRKLRSEGLTFREIANRLGSSPRSVFYAINEAPRPRGLKKPLTDDDNKVVYLVPNNGGCSTQSGLVPVSLPRIRALEKQNG